MEALERRGRVLAIGAILFIVFWSQCRSVEGQRNNTKMSYVCPEEFIRLGHSCYYFSEQETTWQKAMTACREKGSRLTIPARWEDRNLRKYLNKTSIEKTNRWIGGIFDYGAKSWKWGDELKKMHYQSFSKMKKMTDEELKWTCIAMIPKLSYRWSPRKCYDSNRYICQTKLKKMPKSAARELRKRMGKINEISAPSMSRELNDPMMMNDVTVNPVPHPKSFDLRPNAHRWNPKRHGPRSHALTNPKAYDLRPNELKRKQRPSMRNRRLKRPFPGYSWNRRDPEGSYLHNAEILRSGRTGLRPQQVNAHLARLLHLRDKQIARRKRIRDSDDWLINEPAQVFSKAHARTYTVDNNISALHPKTIVEEFDMFPQPPPVAVPQTRG